MHVQMFLFSVRSVVSDNPPPHTRTHTHFLVRSGSWHSLGLLHNYHRRTSLDFFLLSGFQFLYLYLLSSFVSALLLLEQIFQLFFWVKNVSRWNEALGDDSLRQPCAWCSLTLGLLNKAVYYYYPCDSLCQKRGFDPWVGKIPWRRKWQPTPVLWPGEPHGQRSLEGYSPRGRRVGHNWAHTCWGGFLNLMPSCGYMLFFKCFGHTARCVGS